MTAPPQSPPERTRGPGESLLMDLLTNHLDPGYAAAARRRADRPDAPVAGRRLLSLVTVVVLVAAGALLGVAYHQERLSAPKAHRTNTELIAQIGRRTKQLDDSQRQDNALRTSVTTERAKALAQTQEGSRASAELQRLDVATATVPMHGPGVVVTLADGKPSDNPSNVQSRPTGDGLDPSAVQDRDLQSVVNALWASGAEAISINGQRLSSLSTIRAAGQAILVDFRPVLSPYSVRAIGNPDRLQAEFAGSTAARTMQTYTQVYGMTFGTRAAKALTLPAAATPTLRYARAGTPGSATPSPSPSGSTPTGTPTPRATPPGVN